jgi:hypothetical protein
MQVHTGDCWPSNQQELLLDAVLFTGERSTSSWEKWAQSIDLDDVDTASHRLLPLLYKNLTAQGVEHEDMGRYKGVYKRTWYRNRLLLHKAEAVVDLLGRHGIETMLLKGIAQINAYYPDPATRSMNDIDILVPEAEVHRVIELIQENGWGTGLSTAVSRIQFTHSVLFRDADHYEFDLHWHMMEECCQPEAENSVWEHALPIQLGASQTRIPGHTDQLIHTLVHGLRWAPISPIRWVADSVILMRSVEVDWDRLVERAQFCQVVVPVRLGLRYLAQRFDSPVPQDVLERLDGIAVERQQLVEFEVKAVRRTHWRRLRFHWYNYRRLRNQIGEPVQIFGFLVYLQLRLGLPSLKELPGALLRRSRAAPGN